jgi:hypothetical protein
MVYFMTDCLEEKIPKCRAKHAVTELAANSDNGFEKMGIALIGLND